LALHLYNRAAYAFYVLLISPFQAIMQEYCKALPNEKDKYHGLWRFLFEFIALRLREASSSLWPPDKKNIAGTAAGTDLKRVTIVYWATS